MSGLVPLALPDSITADVLTVPEQVNMSVAVIPMAEELGWSATDRGIVNSAFFWGYSITQIPAGWISTRCVWRSAIDVPGMPVPPVLSHAVLSMASP